MPSSDYRPSATIVAIGANAGSGYRGGGAQYSTVDFGGGGGGGGGGTVDTETKRYVDASMRAVKAETDAEFTKIMAKLDSQPKPPPLSQIIGVAVSTVIAVFAILGFSSDRFDGGISASAIVDEALRQIIAQQEIRDASQDARLDRVLAALEALQTTDPNAPGGNN